tara:strand:- start:21166 stop:22671 length:1506 start_codon:yes stop_codon:yes gene_type:complete
MKKLAKYLTLLTIMSLLGFYSCKIEPDFPLPGFENSEREVTIRRDTVPEFFELKLQLNVPNGVSSIEVKDGLTNEHLGNVEGYDNQKEFEMTYKLDLRQISKEKDTVFNLLFRVVDNYDIGFNKAVIVNVKKESRPEIINFEGGDVIKLSGPIYKPEGDAVTGAVPLKSIEYIFNGNQKYFYEVPNDTLIYEFELKKGISFQNDNMVKNQPYPFSIIVTDNRGLTYTKEVSLVLSASLQIPKKIIYYDQRNRTTTINIGTDNASRIDSVSYANGSSTYTYTFEYGTDDKVNKMVYSNYYSRYKRDTRTEYNFAYNATGQISSIRKIYYRVYDSHPTVQEDYEEEVIAQRFTYDSSGAPDGFYGQSEVVEGPFYTDPFDLGEPLFSGYYQTYDVTSTLARNFSSVEEFKTVFMPTYIEGLPPFVYTNSSSNMWFYDLFTRKLMPNKVRAQSQEYKDASYTYLREPNYSYSTTSEGLIDRMTLTFTGGGSSYKGKNYIYEFTY